MADCPELIVSPGAAADSRARLRADPETTAAGVRTLAAIREALDHDDR